MYLKFMVLYYVVMSLFLAGCLPRVGVRKGGHLITKEVFFTPRNENVISIFIGNFHNNAPTIALNCRAWENYNHTLRLFSHTGLLKHSIPLGNRLLGKVIPVDVKQDGQYEYLISSPDTMSLIDHMGKILWEFKKPDGRVWDKIAAGDVDGDGTVEFVGTFIGEIHHDVYVFDDHGEIQHHFILKNSKFDLESLAICDTDGDGISEIVFNGMDGIHIHKVSGELLYKFKPVWGGWHLHFWPEVKEQPLIYGPKGRTLVFTDLTGTVVEEIPLSQDNLYFLHTAPIPVHLNEQEEKPYIGATEVIPYVYDKSYFYIFDPRGRVIYQEVFPGRVGWSVAVRDNKKETEYLLVSIYDRVLKYTWRGPHSLLTK